MGYRALVPPGTRSSITNSSARTQLSSWPPIPPIRWAKTARTGRVLIRTSIQLIRFLILGAAWASETAKKPTAVPRFSGPLIRVTATRFTALAKPFE